MVSSQDNKNLSRDDLFLLMESYRNMIHMHATLSEQQKQILDAQHDIADKQETIYSRQDRALTQLEHLVTNLANNTVALKDLNSSISGQVDAVRDKVEVTKADAFKQHAGINYRLYIIMGLMSSMILGLIALASGLITRFNMLHHIHLMIEKVVDHLKIVVM